MMSLLPTNMASLNVIAPMGVAITERQINKIKKLTHRIAWR
jgi:DNA primase